MELIYNTKGFVDEFSIIRLDGNISYSKDPQRTTVNRIYIYQNGQGSVDIDNAYLQLEKYQVLLIAKGQIFLFSDNTSINGYEITFTDAFWEKAPESASNCKSVLFNLNADNQGLAAAKEDLNELLSVAAMLEQESRGKDYINKTDSLAAYLKIIMIKTANINFSLQDRYNSSDRKIYTQFLELVSQNYQKTREVSVYSGLLNISNKQLAAISKKQGGISPKKIIAGMIVNEAKRMLYFSASSIKEIASILHFSSTEQFSHFFKKQTSLSPQAYRNTGQF